MGIDTSRVLKTAFAAGACMLSLACMAQNTIKVTGTFDQSRSDGSDVKGTFSCTGTPACTGSYSYTGHDSGCSNSLVIAGTIDITGMDLSHPGPIQGQVILRNGDFSDQMNSDGTCTIRPDSFRDLTLPYTAMWSGTAGTGVLTDPGGRPVNFNFTANVNAPPPPFSMVVTASVDAVTANVSANIQFRPQDVGTNGSVFVFAFAPRSIVKRAPSKVVSGDPDPPVAPADSTADCVLAQLNGNGQLQAASVSGLQPYTSGVLGAQGQAVSVLNSVPTPTVAGAQFYVGYGANATSMYNNGVNLSAVSVPGAVQCRSADSIAASYEGLWLKASEAGWGINITHQGTILFATWFTYDTDGSGMWLVMSNGAQTSPGNYSGTLYRTVGPPFSATSFTSIAFPANYTTVGTLSFSFADANTGTMSYTVNGVSQTKAIARYIYATGGTTCILGGPQSTSPNYQDLWLHSPLGTESGWGVNIAHQGDILFATWFTYLAGATQTNKGLWLVMSNGNKTAPGVYSGALQTTTGPAFSATPFNPDNVARTTVGSGTFTFTDANSGTFSYVVNGITQSKAIARYIYSTPATACQ